MRRTQLFAAVVVSAGMLFAASGTAMALDSDTKPAESWPAATVDDSTEPTASKKPTDPATTSKDEAVRARASEPMEALPARPVPGTPRFTG